MSKLDKPAEGGSRGSKSLPRLSILYYKLNELKLDPQNPRTHSKHQVQQIAASIRTFGMNVPILVDAKRRVIAGHGRVFACQVLGIDTVPVIELAELTPEQARAFMIADNRLTENAEWDERLLGESLKFLAEADLDFDIEVTGFEMAEIDLLIEGLAPAPDGELDPADDLSAIAEGPVITQPGDFWKLGSHRILCANALEAESFATLMGKKKASMVFTDPPYNVAIAGHAGGLGTIKHRDFAMACGEMDSATFTDFLLCVFGHLAKVSRAGALHYVCMDWRHLPELLAAGGSAYDEFLNLCVWVKGNGGMGSLYRSEHELILVFKHGKGSHQNNVQLGQYGRYRTNVWRYPGANSFARETEEGNLLELHPTVKPVALVADAILDASKRGEIVLDAFLGSGTTIIAAERTGRICYGLELDPAYVDVAIRRWEAYTGIEAIHSESGQRFRECESAGRDSNG